jgi:hypothetical protein
MRQLIMSVLLLAVGATSISGQVADTVAGPLQQTQHDLSTDGQAFLVREATSASFFMLGELHGENEIPALIRHIWPAMWQAGYRNVAAEISPWAANQLEFGNGRVPVIGLWTQPEATFVASLKRSRAAVLWGCDIEDVQPHLLLRDLAAANPGNEQLRAALDEVSKGYQRRAAPGLLKHVEAAATVNDRLINGVSVRANLVQTFEVESDRSASQPLRASLRREAVMKDLFRQHWLTAGKPKVFLRFGRNHLHRGYDRRGVSTLGNFVAELGAAERARVFNVAAFAGGGKIALLGPQEEADERKDDIAFAYLASIARYPATIFDFRLVRDALHRLPGRARTPLEASLVYWADSYDAIIFYREVTPLRN